MKMTLLKTTLVIGNLMAFNAVAAIRYVNVGGTNPTAPYVDWNTAATNIQDAIDVADPADVILVTNGIYASGGVPNGPTSNRVWITKSVTVQSVNGPAVTIIRGYQVPGTTNGPGAVRCVAITNGATLAGFTLTGGATGPSDIGGGLRATSATAPDAPVITNCVIIGNSSLSLAGATYQGTLWNCTIVSNLVTGTVSSKVYNSVIAGNNGGAWGGTLINCTITGNTGIGTLSAIVSNSIVYYNEVNYSPGTMNYCCTTPAATGVGNITSDPLLASISHLSQASPCRTAGNSAAVVGTDIDGEPWATPPSIGCDQYTVGNVTGPLSVVARVNSTNVTPGFAVNLFAMIDGRTTQSKWDFGDGTSLSNRPYATHAWSFPADYTVTLTAWNETYPAGVSNTLTIHVMADPHIRYVAADSSNPMPPYVDWAHAATVLQDAIDRTQPGDTVLVTNGIYQTGGRTAPFGGSPFNRAAILNSILVKSINGPEFTMIQGVVPFGTNTGIRCVALANGAVLSGFTITNGIVTQPFPISPDNISGGGIYCQSSTAVVSNCVVIGNAAGVLGGGIYSGTANSCTLKSNTITGTSSGPYGPGGAGAAATVLNDCTLSDNKASGYGGGAFLSTLNTCLITNNSATGGGGVANSSMANCLVVGNSATGSSPVYGGGGYYVALSGGSGPIANCTFADNRAYDGGAIYNPPASPAAALSVSNCMFVGNVATNFGGAVYNNSILINCQFRNNSAAEGGAAKSCGLLNCLIVSNQASVNGGGTATCQMTNCTITANSAGNSGGGFYQGSGTRNCIVYFNSAPSSPNFTPSSILNTCTLPLPPLVGGNNITNAPLFVDQAAGNFHLQTSSPCINAGYNGFVLGNTDLDGNPRIAGGIVDMGAYEFQNPTSVLPYAWLQQFGLPIDGSVDFVDTDADGLNNWQEWRALTDPTNAASVLKLAVSQTEAGILLQWPSGIGRKYFVERSSNLLDQPAFQIIQSDISAVSTTTSFTDVEAVGPGPFFYRVGVQY